MAEPGLDGLHRLAVPDEQARVEVPQRVEGGRLWEAGRLHGGSPHPGGERGPPDGRPQLGGEDERVGGPGVEVRRERLEHDLGEGDGPDGRLRLGRREVGRPAGQGDQLAVDGQLAAQEVDPVDPTPKASPWRSPVPAASVTRAR
jgi:hypothetical protein